MDKYYEVLYELSSIFKQFEYISRAYLDLFYFTRLEASILRSATLAADYLDFMTFRASLKSLSSGLNSIPFLKYVSAYLMLFWPSRALAFLYNIFM